MLALAALLPLAVAGALAARPTLPSAGGAPRPAASMAAHRQARVHGDGLTLDALVPATTASAPRELELALRATAPYPELLVYWSDGRPAGEDALPDGSRLLGTIAADAGPRRYPLPPDAGGASPAVLVYDLAHGRVVARLALGGLDAAEGDVR
jgi:hypothetical protein